MADDSSGHPISRRQLLKLAGIASAGLLLEACGASAPAASSTAAPVATPAGAAPTTASTSAESTAPPAPVSAGAASDYEQGELKILVCCYTDPEVELRKKFNAAFEKAHSGVTLTMELLPSGQNYFEKLQTLIASGTTPDVFDMWEGYVQPYAENGALMNLDPFLDTDAKVKKSDILPAAMLAGSWHNSVYALLIGFMPGPVSLYYNVDHFKQAKLPAPTADWKWDDLRTSAKQLTQSKGGAATPDRWGLVFANWFVPQLYWIWSNGGDVFNKDETKSTLTDPKTVQAIQYWADLVNVDKSALPPSQAQALGGERNAFQTGKASLYLGNTWDVGDLKNAKDLNWKAVLSPKANDGNRVWYMHTWCWAISTQSKKPKIGWQYIRDFVLNRTIDASTPTVPPLQTLLPTFDTPRNKELGYDPLLSLAKEPGIVRIPGAGAKWDKISGIIQAEMDLVFSGEKKAADAMAAAGPKVDEELARKS